MKNRVYLVLGVLLVAEVGGLLWWLRREPLEPVYAGEPLSHWYTSYFMDGGWYPLEPPESLLKDRNAVPFLIRALRRESWVAATYRKEVWPKLPSSIKRHLPQPVDDLEIRFGAADILSRMGPMAKPAVPGLVRVLKVDDDFILKQQAILTLTRIGRGDSAVVTALTEALRDKDARVRVSAASALVTIGEGNKSVVVALTGALRDEKWSVREAATNSLQQIDPEAAAKAGVNRPSP